MGNYRRVTNERGEESFSKCGMYNISSQFNLASFPLQNDSKLQIVSCQYGWEYDRTWYTRTVVTQEDWVCEKELQVTNTFVFSRAGDVIGTFIFGQLGDMIGRRPVFFVTLFMLAVGRCITVFAAGSYPLFLAVTFIGSLSQSAAFQSPLVLGMEMSAENKRAQIAMLQCLGWTLGVCLMPMIAWVTGDWIAFIILTSAPCALFFFCYRLFPESARWLAAKGKTRRCARELRHIATVNGTFLPDDAMVKLKLIAAKKERIYGLASLFSNWRLAKNTVLIVYLWVVNSMTYYTLLLIVNSMAGNPFMNFFWQSLVELPGYIVGKFLSDRYGRRWSQSGMFAMLVAAVIIVIGVVRNPELGWLTTSLVVFVKFCFTITFYVIHLVAMETYPTCVRQSGTSLGAVVGSSMGILGPYIVYLGTVFDIRIPYLVIAIVSITGMAAALFLPETLHQRLPETLADAQTFGRDQKFWSLPEKPLDQEKTEMNEVPLKS
ncbi:carcinine transporter-like isoform X2 [Periplaneta americana]|uniref:carcinine transporter-like isoform X2 n=1 Tax=Periplaneta americana TaxID=6978 RepID=UPI0037E99E53